MSSRSVRARRAEAPKDSDKLRGDDYLDIAEIYATGNDAHHRLIRELFGPEATQDQALTTAHYLLLQLPFRYVVTTNYDGLFERALEVLRRPGHRVVRDEDVAHSGTRGRTTIFKIHGDASSKEGLQEVVLTRSEYREFPTRHSTKAALLQALLLNHDFLFVGYSLSDPNLNTIRSAVGAMLESSRRHAWATTLEPRTPGKDGDDNALRWLDFASPRDLWIALDRIASACVDGSRRYLADAKGASRLRSARRPERSGPR